MNHAKLQPSRAHRWLKCLGSAAAEAAAPDVTTEYADRGTALHRLLTGALDDAHLVIHPGRLEFWGDDGKRVAYEVTEADARQVAQVASYVLSTFRAIDGGAVLQTEVYCPVGRHFDLPEDVLSGHADVVIDGDEEWAGRRSKPPSPRSTSIRLIRAIVASCCCSSSTRYGFPKDPRAARSIFSRAGST